MKRLEGAALEEAVGHLEGWSLEQGSLVREAKFPDFVAAMKFVNRVAMLAEEAGHHPDIDIRYNVVKLALVTHDAGGITEKDAEMAETLSREFVGLAD